MRNYRIYLHGFRDLEDYSYALNTRLYFKSEYHDQEDYIIPVKREKKKKSLFSRRDKSLSDSTVEEKFVTIRSNSDASAYFRAEYRGNRISEDCYGNLIVPYSYMDDKPRTR